MFTKECIIPTYEEIKSEISLTKAEREKTESLRREVKAVLDGSDKRKLVIVGPCSVDSDTAALRYFEKLAAIAPKYSDDFLIIPRIYTSKSRSLSYDYNGMVSSPDIGKKVDFAKGIAKARRLHLDTLRRFGFSGADEIVFPELIFYFDDLVSYFVVGARSSTDTLHRQIASGLDAAVGLKNDLSGSKKTLFDGIKSIMSPNTFILSGVQYSTNGNPYVHAILRGKNGDNSFKPNITEKEIELYGRAVEQSPHPAIIVDLNHANSGKDAMKQFDTISLMGKGLKNNKIKGFMIESYLYDGKGGGNGLSFTDSCLGFNNTVRLLDYLSEILNGGN